jgi:hypothetical protein
MLARRTAEPVIKDAQEASKLLKEREERYLTATSS